MTLYELGRLGLEPFLPPLYSLVRSKLRAIVDSHPSRPQVLDVGGRKSPYTIGLPAKVTIMDLPRVADIQKTMNLGITSGIQSELKTRRSNIDAILFGDMTESDLENESFDLVVSVEVLEHVVENEKFVSEVRRVLRPGGLFLMTTPNGDFLENHNPDHIRHYRKKELSALLDRHFVDVSVDYAIVGGRFRMLGLKSWSPKRPIDTSLSIVGNVVNSIQSSKEATKSMPIGTHHLVAMGRKEAS